MTDLDMAKVEAFTGQFATQVIGAVTTAMVVIGDRLGFYRTLARGPATSSGLASDTDTYERLVREWLAQQASIGFVLYDADSGRYALPPEHAAVLAADDTPVAMAGVALLPAGLFRSLDKIVDGFRTGQGVAWSAQDEAVFETTERHFRVGYRNSLVADWIPSLDGVRAKLESGAHVADVGAGHGAALIILAQAFPRSRFVGYDNHRPSIETARKRAAEAGVADRVTFEEANAASYPAGAFDLICFFDSFHDLGDPVGAAAHARRTLAPGGTLMLVEPYALDDLASNVANNPFAALNYAASTGVCLAHSLSEPVGLGLGAQAGEPRLREVLIEAGYRTIRRTAETPFNMVLEARP